MKSKTPRKTVAEEKRKSVQPTSPLQEQVDKSERNKKTRKKPLSFPSVQKVDVSEPLVKALDTIAHLDDAAKKVDEIPADETYQVNTPNQFHNTSGEPLFDRNLDRSASAQEIQYGVEKALDTASSVDVASATSRDNDDEVANQQPSRAGDETMLVTLTRKSKAKGNVFDADGGRGPVKFGKRFFAEGEVPTSFEVEIPGAAPAKQAKRKLTKEERAALPKLTTAQKLERLEARRVALLKKAQKEAATTIS